MHRIYIETLLDIKRCCFVNLRVVSFSRCLKFQQVIRKLLICLLVFKKTNLTFLRLKFSQIDLNSEEFNNLALFISSIAFIYRDN